MEFLSGNENEGQLGDDVVARVRIRFLTTTTVRSQVRVSTGK